MEHEKSEQVPIWLRDNKVDRIWLDIANETKDIKKQVPVQPSLNKLIIKAAEKKQVKDPELIRKYIIEGLEREKDLWD